MLLSSQKKKEIVHSKDSVEHVIQKQGKQLFHNFNLEGEVSFKMNLDIVDQQGEMQLEWHQFTLVRDEYKANDKIVKLVDKSNGQVLELAAKIRSTDQTDLEITFYCHNCIVNNTDQNIILLSTEQKKQKLAG